MEKGIILKGVGGLYEVKTEGGLLECTLRGRLRLADNRVLVGDRVEVTRDGERGVVENVLPRKSELTRPAIANVDQVILVFAVQNPAPSFLLLDRILVQAELAHLDCVVVFNKGELHEEEAKRLQAMYTKIGYPTIITSAKTRLGLTELASRLNQGISTLAGPSGVGKSSLLNALDLNLNLETGEVSSKIQRGRHTTRTVQLLPFGDHGLVADTPGFSQLGFGSDLEAEIQWAFPEIRNLIGECQFRGCLHRHEPGCAVKDALQAGTILRGRYEHYLLFLQEVVPRY